MRAAARGEDAVDADHAVRRSVRRAALGIGLYAGAFGASFGAVATGSGLSTAQAMVLSLVMFSGASQFAFTGVAAGGGSAVAAVAAALLLGLRNAFYGVTLTSVLAPRGLARLWTAHLVIDETTAMAVAQPSVRLQRYAFWTTGIILCALWQVGTLAGALAGAVVDPAVLGLDAAGPAVFLALLWPSLRQVGARWVAVAGSGVALALVPLVPSGVPVLAAVAVAVIGGLWPATGRRGAAQ